MAAQDWAWSYLWCFSDLLNTNLLATVTEAATVLATHGMRRYNAPWSTYRGKVSTFGFRFGLYDVTVAYVVKYLEIGTR